ncbi:carboxypeptidase-like regulatory domain-containing protein [Bacteroides thetaiotaomicron]|uniref:carboxypeptidase-like regulatory domain-containing protein n=1 Tax=Bacteroides thetaiotaomicron TaxID=818 RepID=UPI0021655EA7|nr:carboxypeptidase-like regulatory domain-containing protein [Bacteroides thetaiotaomicron]MCS2191285.1 carboxypeptidase-like regulatory domain-containing protein [Bacteroides thetaiotaomicron]
MESGFVPHCYCVYVHTQLYGTKRNKGSVNDGEWRTITWIICSCKGTTSGTITDLDGKFSINARNNDVLIFSYVGMNTRDIQGKQPAFHFSNYERRRCFTG